MKKLVRLSSVRTSIELIGVIKLLSESLRWENKVKNIC